jgi:hypothetical protein
VSGSGWICRGNIAFSIKEGCRFPAFSPPTQYSCLRGTLRILKTMSNEVHSASCTCSNFRAVAPFERFALHTAYAHAGIRDTAQSASDEKATRDLRAAMGESHELRINAAPVQFCGMKHLQSKGYCLY